MGVVCSKTIPPPITGNEASLKAVNRTIEIKYYGFHSDQISTLRFPRNFHFKAYDIGVRIRNVLKIINRLILRLFNNCSENCFEVDALYHHQKI